MQGTRRELTEGMGVEWVPVIQRKGRRQPTLRVHALTRTLIISSARVPWAVTGVSAATASRTRRRSGAVAYPASALVAVESRAARDRGKETTCTAASTGTATAGAEAQIPSTPYTSGVSLECSCHCSVNATLVGDGACKVTPQQTPGHESSKSWETGCG
jgi:hypothetical protein